jgi:hypothetical protein
MSRTPGRETSCPANLSRSIGPLRVRIERITCPRVIDRQIDSNASTCSCTGRWWVLASIVPLSAPTLVPT